MKIHFAGKYSGDPDSLPHRPHKEGAVAFKEASDTKELAKIANGLAIAVLIIAFVPAVLRHGFAAFPACLPGSLLAMLTLFPHELLHAVCFREEAFVYTNLKDGMLFVVGPEDMSRRRYVWMSLLPNLVFGLLPYLCGMLCSLPWLTMMGAVALSCGAGDYYNVFNAMTQMPKGARTYLHKFNSFWFMPEEETTKI